VSVTPQQRDPILSLCDVEAVRLVLLSRRTGRSVSAVERVVHEPPHKDLKEVEKGAAMPPLPLGCLDHPIRTVVYDNLLVCTPAAPQEPPPRRRHRRERRHDWT